jgi:hypothetical protein
MVHRTHRVSTVPARTLGGMRIGGADPHRDWPERNRADLAGQPNEGKRDKHATQTRHQKTP